MATKKEKLNFSKFFPESTSYVVLEGYAKGSDDYDVTLKIGDGGERITLFTTDWYKDDKMLKALQEAVQKALDFQQKAMKMAKVDLDIPEFDFPVVKAKRATAPKKKAATKK